MTPLLDLDLLRAFVTVAEQRSFTQAADTLLRRQSTVSLQIRRLEDALHRCLLDRTSRRVRLTAAGEALLEPARRMLDEHDRLMASLDAPALAGTVRLGTPEDFATTHLPHVLARFAQAYPAVRLEVTCDLTLNLAARFRQGDFDLVLVKREPERSHRGVRVWREPLVWVAGPPGAGKTALASSWLARRRMVDCLSSKETDHGTGPYLFNREASSRAVEQR